MRRGQGAAPPVALIAVLALAATGCFPLVTPPLKADLGYASRLGGDSGYRFSGGIDVAAISVDPEFPLDIGAGYVQTDTHSTGVPSVRNGGLASTMTPDTDRPVHGIYLESRKRLVGGSFWRVFAGPRFEYYFQPTGPEPGFAGLGRVEIELFHPYEFEPVSGENENGSGAYWGVVYGSFSVGAYLEAGYQHLPNDAAYPLLGGGILLRLPLTAGLVCCAWDLAKSSSSK